MFEYKDFKRILDTTTELMEKIKNASRDEAEELQMRIDSNIQALKIIASKIEDEETKALFLKNIQSLCTTANVTENENIRQRVKGKTQGNNEMIDEELLKNTSKLKNLVQTFSTSLKEDKKAIEKLNEKMHTNSVESTKSMKTLEKQGSSVSAVQIMGVVFLIFILTYLVIRFL